MLMGLLGSATAFETGRPSTLFRGRSILGHHGAVGIAVLKPPHTSTASPIVRYTNMRTLGDPMRVTRSQGNIILTLDSKKATSYLLEVIKKSDDINESARSSELIISKEKEFYLGFLNEQHMVVEICRIIGGSTSRGTMALDREKEIKVDQMVQFIHSSELAGGTGIERAHEQAPEPSPTMSPVSTETIELEFSCSDGLSSGPPGLGSQDDVGKVETIEGVFCGASEAGFVPSHQTIVNLAHSFVQYKL